VAKGFNPKGWELRGLDQFR